jgi:hypothetical protein
MTRRLSSRLSAQAKKAVLRTPQEPVTGNLELTANADAVEVERAIKKHGGRVRSKDKESRLMTFEINAEHLESLADLESVLHVSVAEPYRS